jgi:hypothetical protein
LKILEKSGKILENTGKAWKSLKNLKNPGKSWKILEKSGKDRKSLKKPGKAFFLQGPKFSISLDF